LEKLLEEFVLLFTLLNEMQLSEEKDMIRWRWTTTGEYSASSVYEIQFLGAYPLFRVHNLASESGAQMPLLRLVGAARKNSYGG
jgi:hypothetical protein